MGPLWATILLLATAPFAVLCASFDLTRMRIPNWLVISLFLVFLLLGPWAFGLSGFSVRIVQVAVVFGLGWLLNSFLGIGGGDGKFAAASAGFIAPADYGLTIVMLAVLSLIAVFGHRALGRSLAMRDLTKDWASYSAGDKFPFGLPLAATLVCYHFLQLYRTL